MTQTVDFSLDIKTLHQRYESNEITPQALIEVLLKKREEFKDYNIWINAFSLEEIQPWLDQLKDHSPATLPLYGIPFAIKDNIDLGRIPTTAGCPAYTYTPDSDAFVVKLLIEAGAIPLGKTSLDQFATGLVGTRSPEPLGPCKNSLNPEIISGGSSSGSAVAVALGLVSFSLGTDTAGSGRVPAMLNNIYGLKPTKGVFSTTGIVPACRSLDCPSVFAVNVEDMVSVFTVLAQYDEDDAYSRPNPFSNGVRFWGQPGTSPIIGVPLKENLEFFGGEDAEQLFESAVERWHESGATIIETDISPLLAAARLLYEGPWVSERYAAIESFIEQHPDEMHPVVYDIIAQGKDKKASDAFKAEYQMQEYRKQAALLLKSVDFLLTPTAPRAWTINEVLADPVSLNSKMGYYTNYMNLLDLCGIAVPAGFLNSGAGFGTTLIAPAFNDMKLLAWVWHWQQLWGQVSGANLPEPFRSQPPVVNENDNMIIAVCGAHLSGMPLNWQLTERGARLMQSTTTAPCYRMFVLAGGAVQRPALMRDSEKGQAIELELWSLPRTEVGSFLEHIGGPLGLGKLETSEGKWVTGFICEMNGVSEGDKENGAEEITALGSWRKYILELNN